MKAESDQGGASAVRGMYHLFMGNTSYTIMLAVSAIIVGRILGPDGCGLYTIALIVPPFLFNAIRLGLDSAATRYAAMLRSEGRESEAKSFVYATTILEVVIGGTLTIAFVGLSGVVASSVLHRPSIAGLILPVSMVSIVGQSGYTVASGGLTGLGKYDRAALFQAIQGFTRLVVSTSLVVLGFGVAGAVTGYTVAFLVSGILGVGLVARMAGGKVPKGMRRDLVTGLTYGFPVYLSLLASGFVAPLINTVLALTVSNSQVGGYAAASTFNSLIALFAYPITTALFPFFSRSVDDHVYLAKAYRTAVWFTALLVLPVASFIIAFSSPLMVTFYGRAYSFGGPYLALLTLITLFAGVGNLAWSSLLNGIGHTKDTLLATALGSAVSVAAAVGLIVGFGVAGAIIGQMLGTGVLTALGTWMVRRRLQVGLGLASPWKIYLSSSLAAAVSFPVTLLVGTPQLSVGLGALVFLGAFIPILAVLRTMGREEIRSLREYFGFSSVISGVLEVAIRYYEFVARLREDGTTDLPAP